jgi:hypothetical protein
MADSPLGLDEKVNEVLSASILNRPSVDQITISAPTQAQFRLRDQVIYQAILAALARKAVVEIIRRFCILFLL